MDISPVLMPGAVAATDAPSSTAAVPGDAFAAVFASALGEVPEVPLPSAVDGIPVASTAQSPSPTTVSLPSAVNALGTASVGPSVPVVPEVPTTKAPPAVAVSPAAGTKGTIPPEGGEAETRLSEEAQAPKDAPVRPGRSRARTKIEAPPEPPPPDGSLAIASEKEAPTTAPNAPVTPLDRSSEKPLPVELDTPAPSVAQTLGAVPLASVPTLTAADVSSATPPPTVSKSVPTTAVSAPAGRSATLGSVHAARPASKPLLVDGSPEEPLSEETGGFPEDVEFTPLVVSAGTVPSSPTEALVPPDPGTATLGARPEIGTTPSLATAPDLGVVPQVLVPPTTGVSPDPKAGALPNSVPNAQVDAFAAGRTTVPTAVAVDKPSPKSSEKAGETEAPAFEIEAAFLEREATKGDDAPSDGAPKDSAPQAGSEPALKSVAADRPEVGSDRPSLDRHLVVRQVADRIENMLAARPKDGVTVHLEPRDLGTITLVVKGLSSALDVQVTASDDRVRQSIDVSRPELAQSLAPRGIELRELRVSTTPSGVSGASATNSNAQSGGQANPEGRSRPQTPSQPFVKSSRAESAAPRSVRRSSGRGVDLLV